MSTSKYYGHGKLLLTGEYAVLDGAEALAIPTKFGQHLEVTSNKSGEHNWLSIDNSGKEWLKYSFSVEPITREEETLVQLLEIIADLNPKIFENKTYDFKTTLEFEREWGLGSSSTLVYCLAKWANINAYTLLERSFGGSGYDIAAAGYDMPIVYTRKDVTPKVQPRLLNFSFEKQLFFAYLGKKKNSRDAIRQYRLHSSNDYFLNEVSRLTQAFIMSRDLLDAQDVITHHEQLIGERLNATPIKKDRFQDFNGAVKSLGGWGGDFILLASDWSKKEVENYLKKKDLDILFSYKDMIFNND